MRDQHDQPSIVSQFEPLNVPPGSKQAVEWQFGVQPDGTPITIPLIVIAGSQPGQRAGNIAVLTAGIHGDEYEGIVALWRLADRIDPTQVAGRLLIIPIVHRAAYNTATRHSPIDGVNLARSFPGDPTGTITQRLAYFVFENVIRRANVLIDCHSGGVRLAFTAVAGFYRAGSGITANTAAASLELAKQFGLTYVWEMPTRSGVLSCEAARIGVSVTGAEIGGRGGRVDADSRLYADGILNILRTNGFLHDSPATPHSYSTYLSGDWALAPIGGLLENHVELDQHVDSGTRLATIRDAFGLARAELRSHTAGVVMGVRHLPAIYPGEWATCVVEEKML